MPDGVDWIGVDWGTTRRRAWRYAGDTLARRADDDQGLIASAPHFARSLARLLEALGSSTDRTVVLAGMVGSASGWQEVPYLDDRTPLHELPRQVVRLDRPDAPAGTWIVPGVRWRGAGDTVDVMRGEETQLLGAMRLADARADGGASSADGWYLLPGTHSKWVRIEQGRVAWMRTYLSGELYGLLRDRGTLSPLLQADAQAGESERAAFERGVRAAADAPVSHVLFSARARVVTGDLTRQAGAAFVSGALFGAEWHDVTALAERPARVRMIGDPALCAYHARCAALLDVETQVLDVDAVQAAAWTCLREAGPAGRERR